MTYLWNIVNSNIQDEIFYHTSLVFGDPHQNINPPPPGAPGVLKSQIPHPLGPRGFQILNPPPLKGVGAY